MLTAIFLSSCWDAYPARRPNLLDKNLGVSYELLKLQYMRFYLKPVSPLNWECKMSAMESTTGCCSCRSLSCSRNPKCSSEKFNTVKL